MEASNDVCDAVRILNHSTLRVPYESLNKTYRSVQKQMDKEITAISRNADELAKAKTQKEVNTILTGVIDKLSRLKRKAGEGLEEEVTHLRSAKRRVEHLRSAEKPTAGGGGGCGGGVSGVNGGVGGRGFWEKRRIVCMLVDYFLRHGYYGTAQKLAQLHDVEDLTSLPYFAAAQSVEKALAGEDTSRAVAWCSEHRSKLRKLGSNFEYSLRLQEFVQLVQSGKRLDAVKHARKFLSPESDSELPESVLSERNSSLCQAMALLALPADKQVEKYRHLTEPEAWQRLVQNFRQVNCAVFCVSADTVLCATLQTGLSALKTNQCGKKDKRCLDCPVCQPYFRELAAGLPRAQYTQSRLMCPVSKLPMDHDNPPMALPNGNIYSQKSLEAMAAKNDGRVACPRTGEEYSLSEAKRVYIM